MIDNIHDTNEFRVFLNKRIDSKAEYNKEKIEVYTQIRDLETQQAEILKQKEDNDEASK